MSEQITHPFFKKDIKNIYNWIRRSEKILIISRIVLVLFMMVVVISVEDIYRISFVLLYAIAFSDSFNDYFNTERHQLHEHSMHNISLVVIRGQERLKLMTASIYGIGYPVFIIFILFQESYILHAFIAMAALLPIGIYGCMLLYKMPFKGRLIIDETYDIWYRKVGIAELPCSNKKGKHLNLNQNFASASMMIIGLFMCILTIIELIDVIITKSIMLVYICIYLSLIFIFIPDNKLYAPTTCNCNN